MHQTYEKKLKHKADFRVKYRFYNEQEGGRKSIPHQEYRSDFWYENADHENNWLFMIWPEFEDETGNVILETDKSVKETGIAQMWIINKENRAYHKEKIKVGTIGYFMEGSRKVAECEVIEIIGLLENPTE